MADDERHFQAYFEELQRWISPKDIDPLRRAAGSAEDMIERIGRVENLLKQSEQREAVWGFLRRAATVFVAVLAALSVAKGLLPPGWLPW